MDPGGVFSHFPTCESSFGGGGGFPKDSTDGLVYLACPVSALIASSGPAQRGG